MSIVSFLSLMLYADYALGIPTLGLVRLNERVEANISLAGQPMGQRAVGAALEGWREQRGIKHLQP